MTEADEADEAEREELYSLLAEFIVLINNDQAEIFHHFQKIWDKLIAIRRELRETKRELKSYRK
jgi:hypothetical protein